MSLSLTLASRRTLLVACLVVGCGQPAQQKRTNTPSSGGLGDTGGGDTTGGTTGAAGSGAAGTGGHAGNGGGSGSSGSAGSGGGGSGGSSGRGGGQDAAVSQPDADLGGTPDAPVDAPVTVDAPVDAPFFLPDAPSDLPVTPDLALDTASPDTAAHDLAPDLTPPIDLAPDTSPDTGASIALCTPSGARPALKKTLIVGGLAKPTEIGAPPDEPGTLWVLEHRNGNVRIIQNGTLLAAPLTHVTVEARGNDEEGLYSLAFAPDYATSKLFYLFYSATNDPDYSTTVDEFHKTSSTSATFVRNVYSRPSSHQYHNGGSLAFNPVDHNLYISVGDNNADCGPACSEYTEGDFGRVLRINLSTKTGTTLHYGLRNPYRFSFDAQTGDIYIGDVGETGTNSENVFYRRWGANTTDFGWGTGNRPAALDQTDSGTPIIGGIVYRGTKMPGLCGYYVYGRFNGGPIKTLKVVNGAATNVAASAIQTAKLSSLGADQSGELYFSEYIDGTVYRIDPQ